MASEQGKPLEPYNGHAEKLAMMHMKRKVPFDQGKLEKVEDIRGLLEVLTGEMKLPDEIEARIWMTIIGEVMEAQGQGIRIEGQEWSLLDMLLAVADMSDEFPVLLLIEVMLAHDQPVVVIRGNPVHAGQLYNITYNGWSKMEDLKVRARHHFKFGFLLLTIGEGERAADQLYLANQADPSSAAKDLLVKMASAAEGKSITTQSGIVVKLAGDGVEFDTSEAGEIIAGISADGTDAAEAAQQQPAMPSQAAPRPAGESKPLLRDDEGESEGPNFVLIGAVVAGLAVAGFAAFKILGGKKQ